MGSEAGRRRSLFFLATILLDRHRMITYAAVFRSRQSPIGNFRSKSEPL
jgi:hypothetical protein